MRIIFIFTFIFIIFTTSCQKSYIYVEEFIDIYNYTIYQTQQTTYASVEYRATPYSRIFWSTPDTIFVMGMNGTGEKTPIVCCSTYTREDGTGQQLVLLPDRYDVKTWVVIGSINNNVKDSCIIK